MSYKLFAIFTLGVISHEISPYFSYLTIGGCMIYYTNIINTEAIKKVINKETFRNVIINGTKTFISSYKLIKDELGEGEKESKEGEKESKEGNRSNKKKIK